MAIIYLAGALLPRSERSTRLFSDERRTTCMNLHPVRFTLPPCVTAGAVGSYPTISPLPRRIGAVSFLWHWLSRYRDLPVRKHGSRWCSDFPPPESSKSDCPGTFN